MPPVPAAIAPADAEDGVRRVGGLLVLGAALLAWLDGGFDTPRWTVTAIVVLWAAVLCGWKSRTAPLDRLVLVALGAYALLCAWTLASVLWADTPGRALEGAGRTALYGLVLAIGLLPRWPRTALRRLLGLVGAAVTLVAILTLLRIDAADAPSRFFIDGRLVAPTGYVNATAGLWAIALFPLVHLAAGGARHPALRVAALAGAGIVLQTSLLSQSRGAILAMGVAAVVLVVLTPNRGAVLLTFGALGAATAPVASALTNVRGAPSVAVLADRLDTAVGRIAVAVLALAALGALFQLVLRLLPGHARETLSWPLIGNGVALALVAVVVIGGTAKVGNPVSWGKDRVHEALYGGYAGVPTTGDRLTSSLGSNRGDMYRVAMKAFRSKPLTGVGAEDFQPFYLEFRDSDEAPRYAHSLELGILSGLGIVGALLALVAYGAPVVSALRRLRRVETPTRAGIAAALAGFTAWLAGSSWDWTWEFPALTILAFLLLAAAARATELEGTAPTAQLRAIRERARAHGVAVPGVSPLAPLLPRSNAGRGIAAGALAAALALTVALGSVGYAAYLLKRGSAAARTDPVAAARDLERASRFNRLDSDALLSRAIVVRRTGDEDGWRRNLEQALDRSPKDWFAQFELGMADARAGRRTEALAALRLAARLNPEQELIGDVVTLVRRGRTVNPTEIEVTMANGLKARLAPTQ
ncbi:O-antigen ligase family protein [Patulibacter minatonensis]|uniref:O-antigen ligase family protein n=1 Tax=Patulibacter minatonensis TaxID=298163 RepID=UPI00047BC96C|nr:O-antigen ligase family protein [Patulibacter minatonensis]